MFKLAVFTDEVSQDFQHAVDVAREFDLDGLEIRSVWNKKPQNLDKPDIAKMREILEDTGLAVCCIASPFFKCDIDSEEEYKEHLDILRRCIALGRSFDCRIIRGFTFWRKGHYKERWQEIIDKFEEPLKILEAEDVVLGIENEASTFLGTAGSVKRFIDELASPYVKAVWDPRNSLGEPVEEDKEVPYPDGYEIIKGDMVHMHIKDSAVDPETGKRRGVAVGEGDIDYVAQFRTMKEDGYEGFASLETHFRLKKPLSPEEVDKPGGKAFSMDAEGASRICLENIKKILKEI